MWNGSRSGPQGGMRFRGEPRGGMFGRDGGRPDFRGRDGMNMDRPPMDVRRFDGPPDMRGQDMGFLERGREPPRDFFGPGSDMNFRRPFEMDQRNSGGFMGQSRPGMNMNNRDMKGGNMRGPDDGFMNMDMRERLQMDGSGPPIDIRRRLAMVAMGGNGDGADMRNRERPMMGNMDGFGMNMPPRDRPGMDFDRWGSPAPNNHRGRFDSEMNMRSRIGSPGDFRDLPSKMFRDHDGVPMDRRGRPDMPLGHGGPDSMAPPDELNLRDRKFQDSMETPKGFRGRESESMCDDWQKSGLRDRDSAPPLMNRTPPQFSREMQEKFPPNHGNDGDRGDHSFTQKDGDMFPGKDGLLFPPPSERSSSSKTWDRNFPNEFSSQMKPPSDPPLNTLSREGDALWQSGRDETLPDRMAPSIGRPPFSKNPPNHGHHFANDQGSFRGSGDTASDHGPKIDNVMSGPKELVSSRGERCDQDYRDIDYRTSSGRKFEYNIEELQVAKKDLLEPKLDAASQLDSSQDQDYRASVVPDKVSKTIAISEIPKTATMQQILLAFAVRNGVPMQGMKIKDVVPGYSYDTAYVEFLNLEDAVHFMETNQGSVKVGDKTARLQYFESDKTVNEQLQEPAASMTSGDGLLPVPLPDTEGDTSTKPLPDPVSQNVWERNSNLTPEAWQQQVDQLQQQDAESPSDDWTNQRSLRPNVHHFDPVFKESKTMIIKNILPTTTVETILKALEQYTYLDERNVRLVKGKSPGSKCFCFVDMDSHEHVTRLVDLLTKPRPIMIDGVRVYAEVAKPLKNQNFKRENEKSNTSLLGFPPDVIMQQQQFQQQQYFPPPSHTSIGVPPPIVHGDSAGADGSGFTVPMQSSSSTPSLMYSETMTAQQSSENQAAALLDPSLSGESSDGYSYAAGSEDPDLSAFLYDATSGFYYDPQTTLYYDPNSRYFYDAQNQQYLYWDSGTKTYIPVQSSEGLEPSPETSVPTAPSGEVLAVAITGEEMKAASETSPDVEDELGSRSERKEKEKEEKPKSLAAFKIMKDMERWAKIQNRHKDSVRTPSPLLKSGDDSKLSKAADAAFAIFERKVTGAEDLFKKPLAPPKKEERGAKRPMGSLGMLAADYGAGSDEEEEEKHEKQETSRPVPSQPQADEREDRLTDWKKMACLLCRRQFPNKDALIRHQQLSDLHKQNMEIHLKIKRSKKELEALENQEKEMKLTQKESNGSPEVKRRKQSHSWAGGSRGAHKGSERPGLGLEPPERKKKEPVVWNHATYKQAVRKAMFARFNELD